MDQSNVLPPLEWKNELEAVSLPEKAINYINRISNLIGAKIDLVSTSPKREDTILLNDVFA